MVKSIEIIQEDPEDHESDLIIRYRGVDTSGEPFIYEVGEVAYNGVQASVAATLSTQAATWGVTDDII